MAATPDLGELLAEAADAVELWSDRAHYWRSVAIDFAAGRREAYPVPPLAAQRLSESVPLRMQWPNPDGDVHPLVADLTALRRWWVRNNVRPLGEVES